MTISVKKKFELYQDIEENGFCVDLIKLSYGDERPPFEKKIQIIQSSKETIYFVITISFQKHINKDNKYTIDVTEYTCKDNNYFMCTNNSHFSKVYHTEHTRNYRFKHLKELCHMFTTDEIKKRILKDYENYKNNGVA